MNKLIFKAGRRIKSYSRLYIPHNKKYKPSGVYASVHEFLARNPDGGRLYEIFPSHVSRLEIDPEFVEACPPYLKPQMEIDQPPAFVLEMPNGRAVADLLGRHIAYVSADNRLIGELSFQWENGKMLPAEKNRILRQAYFDEPVFYHGNVFSLLSGAAGAFNYFHWFIDTFPKLCLAKKAGLLESIDWLLVPSFRHPFQKEYLALLGIHESRIIRGDEKRHIGAEKLIVPSHTRGSAAHIPEWIPRFYREEILPKVKVNSQAKRRIYISRNDSDKRRTLNEEQLIPILEKYGFEIHQLNNKSTEEQIKLFASAAFIVSPHGAGLSNLVYCSPGSRVIEFFPGGYVKATYYDLSKKCGLKYRHLIFDKDKEASNAVEGQKIHITADVGRIEHAIAESLEERE